jgi:hypothetical protein
MRYMPTVPQHASEVEVATLVEITIPGVLPIIRAQNYCPGDYFYCGFPYTFCDFDIGGIPRQLDLANSSTSVKLGNRSASHDGIAPIRNSLRLNNGWRTARVVVTVLFPDYPDAAPIVNRLQILSSSLQAATVQINLKSAIEAINAQVPTSFMSRQTIPELPFFQGTGGL